MFIKSVVRKSSGKTSRICKKILGGGGNRYKSIAQKFLAVGVSFSLAAAMVPLGQSRFVAEAAEPEVTIPIEMFATPADLLKLSEETNDGTGLLATGTDSDKVVKINFGARDNDVKYYTDVSLTENTATAGAVTWLVAGAEDSNSDGSADSLVLYSEKPIMSATDLDAGCTSSFNPDESDRDYSATANTGYGAEDTTLTVDCTHWGACALRLRLDALRVSMFASLELDQMRPSTISTRDGKNDVHYKTTDVLYLPRLEGGSNGPSNPLVTLGSHDTINMHRSYAAGLSWLRSPSLQGGETILSMSPSYFNTSGADENKVAVAGAFRLDLDSILFSTAVSSRSEAATSGFSRVTPGAPMTLRMDGTNSGAPLETAVIQAEGTTLTYTAPANSRLMAIVTTDDGATYQYAEGIDTAAADATFDFGSVAELVGETVTAKAWIEADMPEGGTLTYATEPVALAGTVEEVEPPADPEQPEFPEEPEIVVPDGDDITATPPLSEIPSDSPVAETIGTNRLSTTVNGLNIFVEDPNNALPDGVYLDIQLIEPGSDRWNELSANYDGTHEVENVSFFEITLRYIKDDSPVEMPLSSPIRVLMQIPDGWDKTDMEAVLIASGADRQFEESIVTRDGIDYVAFWSDHFSPYALIDKLSASEKSANKTSPQTGDEVTYLTISGLGLIMTLALGLMLTTVFGKRKFDE